MKFYKKQKRLFNCLILLIIIYILNSYDILATISLKTGSYFWNVDKNTVGFLGDIIKSLNNFSYLSKGIVAGVITYLGNAYRIECENNNYDLFFRKRNGFKDYLKEWLNGFKMITIVMVVFTFGFSLISKINMMTFIILSMLLINLFLHVVFINEISLLLRRKIKILQNVRYLVEVLSFSTILLEVLLGFRDMSLFFSTDYLMILFFLIIDLSLYFFLRKSKCFQRNYDCIYTSYDIK